MNPNDLLEARRNSEATVLRSAYAAGALSSLVDTLTRPEDFDLVEELVDAIELLENALAVLKARKHEF